MAVVTFMFSASGTQTWTADGDYLLTAVSKTSGTNGAGISTDPRFALSDISAPAKTGTQLECLVNMQSSNTFQSGLRVPVAEGSVLIVTLLAAGSVLCYFD